MSDENPSVLERLAIAARYALVALFAAALASGWLAATGDRAYAATPIGAAPNYLSFTVKNGGNSKFYLTDTNQRTICVYTLVNESIKLVGVRKFDVDSQVVDSSIKGHTFPALESANGVTREQAGVYVKLCQPTLDNASQKFGNPMGPVGGDQ